MSSNHNKAAYTLGLATIGLLASYPFQQSFFGGLAVSGFQAALVGGLADWFAVSALFRKPLGIPFRTALIPRNRDKIFSSLTEMVERELLSGENIKKTLAGYDIADVLLHFVEEHNGKKYLKEIIRKFANLFGRAMQPEDFAVTVSALIREKAEEFQLSLFLLEAAEWMKKRQWDDELLDILLEQVKKIVTDAHMNDLLAELFMEVRHSYERGMGRRILFNEVLNLSPKQVAVDVQMSLAELVEKLKDHEHPLRIKAKTAVYDWLETFKTNQALQKQVEDWKLAQLAQPGKLEALLLRLASAWQAGLLIRSRDALWLDQLDILVDDFARSGDKRQQLNQMVRTVISNWVDGNHAAIGSLVRANLNSFSDEQLVAFIEQKVGNDLQMIRINGSVVGGLAGMVIYLLTIWW